MSKRVGRSYSRIEAPRSILILKPSSFGDIIHTLPVVARLKAAWPECRISWLANTEWLPLLAGNPDVDEVVPFPRQAFRGAWGLPKFFRWCQEVIVGRQPDLALDFQGLLRSALIGRVSGAKLFYGMADAREGARWFYDHVAPLPTDVVHAVDRYMILAETVLTRTGVNGPNAEGASAIFRLPPGDVPSVAVERLHDDFILLHPFARGAGKSLTTKQIEAFCQRLAPRQVVLVGRRGGTGCDVPTAVVDLLDRTSLSQLIWMIRRASGVISVDSGPAHLAAVLGKPLVAIHTWSDPRRVGPYRADAWIWKNGCLLPMDQLRAKEEAFFQQRPSRLANADVEAICALATSLLDSCA